MSNNPQQPGAWGPPPQQPGYPPQPGAYPPPGYPPQPVYGYPPRYAGFWIRFGAYLIDIIITLVLIITIIGPLLYMPLCWWKRGATFGQSALGLKVVREADGGPIDGGTAFVRYIVWMLESFGTYILVGLLGFIWAAFDSRKQAWHDKAAGTVVIHVN
jgi:uncharacterized RDD family membrane protein YckC